MIGVAELQAAEVDRVQAAIPQQQRAERVARANGPSSVVIGAPEEEIHAAIHCETYRQSVLPTLRPTTRDNPC